MYVYVLVARNTDLVGDKIFTIVFMIHDKKYSDVHSFFWNFLVKKIEFNASVPIDTDRDKSITNAIKEQELGDNLLYFLNHIRQDLKRWLHASQLPKKEHYKYRSLIRQLFEAKTEAEFKFQSELLKEQVSSSFAKYYSNELEADIKNIVLHWFTQSFQCSPMGVNQLMTPLNLWTICFNATINAKSCRLICY